ncbi:MAG: hypothetical protein OEU26_16840 [Candidatus Tectomicrobia bacterium]|nr:hypothetical protein [Candidatus Tectomicrobia bacterium]
MTNADYQILDVATSHDPMANEALELARTLAAPVQHRIALPRRALSTRSFLNRIGDSQPTIKLFRSYKPR